jgi:hypothetical protein
MLGNGLFLRYGPVLAIEAGEVATIGSAGKNERAGMKVIQRLLLYGINTNGDTLLIG